MKHIIDCDAQPFIPDGWQVEEHIKGGQFEWKDEAISLYFFHEQKNGIIEHNKLRKELASQPVLNANVLDYLLAHPGLIPDEWKDKIVFFWGTIYCGSIGILYVRCLCWGGESWHWNSDWLVSDWNARNPVAVRTSSDASEPFGTSSNLILEATVVENRDGKKLLALYREKREYEVHTLDGYKPKHEIVYDSFSAQMYTLVSNEIDVLSMSISGRAKTRIRKECRERKIPYPDFKQV